MIRLAISVPIRRARDPGYWRRAELQTVLNVSYVRKNDELQAKPRENTKQDAKAEKRRRRELFARNDAPELEMKSIPAACCAKPILGLCREIGLRSGYLPPCAHALIR
jgi:hypothetical protein